MASELRGSKQKLLELLLTLGALIGVIVSLSISNSPNTDVPTTFNRIFSVTLIVFIVSSLVTYVELLSHRDFGRQYFYSVWVLSVSFGWLTFLAAARPFLEIVLSIMAVGDQYSRLFLVSLVIGLELLVLSTISDKLLERETTILDAA